MDKASTEVRPKQALPLFYFWAVSLSEILCSREGDSKKLEIKKTFLSKAKLFNPPPPSLN